MREKVVPIYFEENQVGSVGIEIMDRGYVLVQGATLANREMAQLMFDKTHSVRLVSEQEG